MIKRKTGNPDVDANVVDLDDRMKLLEANALLRGRSILGVALANATDVQVRHQLGRTPIGYLNAGITGAASAGYINVISRDVDFLTLRATGYGATIALSMWVF